jgi:hypothetical protein
MLIVIQVLKIPCCHGARGLITFGTLHVSSSSISSAGCNRFVSGTLTLGELLSVTLSQYCTAYPLEYGGGAHTTSPNYEYILCERVT